MQSILIYGERHERNTTETHGNARRHTVISKIESDCTGNDTEVTEPVVVDLRVSKPTRASPKTHRRGPRKNVIVNPGYSSSEDLSSKNRKKKNPVTGAMPSNLLQAIKSHPRVTVAELVTLKIKVPEADKKSIKIELDEEKTLQDVVPLIAPLLGDHVLEGPEALYQFFASHRKVPLAIQTQLQYLPTKELVFRNPSAKKQKASGFLRSLHRSNYGSKPLSQSKEKCPSPLSGTPALHIPCIERKIVRRFIQWLIRADGK